MVAAIMAVAAGPALATPGGSGSQGSAPGPGGTPEPASPLGEWRTNAASGEPGQAGYCVAESTYNNGRTLIVGRNGAGEINLAIAMPEAGMPKQRRWPVTIEIDGNFKRERTAIAAGPEMLVIANGSDLELLRRLGTGQRLSISGPQDSVAFKLVGAGRALTEIEKCLAERGLGPSAAGAAPTLPKPLAALLKAAGLGRAQPLPLSHQPAENRAADAAWRLGPIMGGMIENAVSDGRDLAALSEAYGKTLKARCPGRFELSFTPIENLPAAALRTGTARCIDEREQGNRGQVYIPLVLYLTTNQRFTVFFHESAEADRAQADQARDNLAQVLRRLAAKPPRKP